MFVTDGGRAMYSAPISPATSTPIRVTGSETGGKYFGPTSWSSDGARLVGPLSSPSGHYSGVGLYDLESHRTTELSTDVTPAVLWLPDSRRIMYFTGRGTQLVVMDTVTRVRTVVAVALPACSADDVFSISPDGRAIYYGAARAEADIWIVERR